MESPIYTIKRQKVWIYPGDAPWHFVNVGKGISKEIKELFGEWSGGFGSLPVKVIVGKTTWKTSIFPDKKSGSYLLPLKASVRKKENIIADKTLSYSIEILV